MQLELFDDPGAPRPPDQDARDFAVDPANHVVLEASAGTGKTRVLVDRFVRLLEAGVDPRHILAVTFTRKAAAEMRDRVLAELARHAEEGATAPTRWRELRDRLADIQVSTIDAFCFGLLREFPLEAGVDPAFEIADETEIARFAHEALDLTMREARRLVVDVETVRLLFARVKLPRLADALASLVDRRHVALPAVRTFVARHARVADAAAVGAAFIARVRDLVAGSSCGRALIDDGPIGSPEFGWLHADLVALDRFPADDPHRVQQFHRRLERYLTRDGEPRSRAATRFDKSQFASADAKKRHDVAIKTLAPDVLTCLASLARDVDGLLARGLLRVLEIATRNYERLLDDHALVDFASMLDRAVALLERQEEFARSRLKLQSRYHHLLVDEFQDTNRLQWRLIALLIEAWREGEGSADAPTSIFIVGDRKQSIYRFRHAEVTLLDEAAAMIGALRPGRTVRRAISSSFRAVPELLAFINAVSTAMEGDVALEDAFRYGERDRFPIAAVGPGAMRDGAPVVGLIARPSMPETAAIVAAEIAGLIGRATVRDRHGAPRPAEPDDIAILFRARAGHQYFEEALDARGVRTYVYKGLGFFDAPEVQDLQALLRYLARPDSDLAAAELLRSRFVRLSDVALARLAPDFARVLETPVFDSTPFALDAADRALLERAREGTARWRRDAAHRAPSDVLDRVMRESAYAMELGGRRWDQSRENVKKVRALVRRVENRGYATIDRLASYFETLRAGEESNAVVAARGCVQLMTIHAAKGLEFPIVFVVNLHVGGRGQPVLSVIERDEHGEPQVAFGPTAATKFEERREREELRRLLYVAMTRARDRLYLAAELDAHGRLVKAPKSLAGLLPRSLAEAFGQCAGVALDTSWQTPDQAFTLRVCRAPLDAARELAPERETDEPAILDIAPLGVAVPAVVTATAQSSVDAADFVDATHELMAPAERLTGTIVHRLFQRLRGDVREETAIAALVPSLVSAAERVDVDDLGALAARAASAYLRLQGHADVTGLLDGAAAEYEVPFSYRPVDRPGQIVRGVADCVIRGPDGRITILEFKTGRPRPEHEAQAAQYAAALSAVMGDDVGVRIIYP